MLHDAKDILLGHPRCPCLSITHVSNGVCAWRYVCACPRTCGPAGKPCCITREWAVRGVICPRCSTKESTVYPPVSVLGAQGHWATAAAGGHRPHPAAGPTLMRAHRHAAGAAKKGIAGPSPQPLPGRFLHQTARCLHRRPHWHRVRADRQRATRWGSHNAGQKELQGVSSA